MEQDLREQLAVVWRALHGYRHDLIPEGIDKGYDEEWDEICESMASIEIFLLLNRGAWTEPRSR
jgi:hypothetical protein